MNYGRTTTFDIGDIFVYEPAHIVQRISQQASLFTVLRDITGIDLFFYPAAYLDGISSQLQAFGRLAPVPRFGLNQLDLSLGIYLLSFKRPSIH